MRKLASIRKVLDIQPIKDADKIELISIDGWKVVAQKNLYKINDLVIYFEVDSFLPIIPQFEFLRKSCFKSHPDLGEGFRIKTIKLRGQISQGLILPIHEFTENVVNNFTIGDDLTEYLGVKKYEAPVAQSVKDIAIGSFPDFVRKTDQERYENIINEIPKDKTWEVTEKLDGSSVTIYQKDGIYGVCSRNLELKPDNKYWKAAQPIIDILKSNTIVSDFAIQGELIGPGVQGNKYKLSELKIFIFDLYDIDNQIYASRQESDDFLKVHKLENYKIPVLDKIHSNEIEDYINFIKNNNLKSRLNSEILAEGVVLKTLERESSFKFINPEWLLENE